MTPLPAPRPVLDLFDAAATAVVLVVVVGDELRIRYVNPRALEVFGWAASELVGQPVDVLLAPGQHGALEATGWRTGGTRKELRGRRKDGVEFAAEVSLTPMETPEGSWAVASVLDVSRRRDAEERVRRQSRTYLALARINEAVATCEDEDTLFRRACNVAVVDGGLIGAWVFTRDHAGTVALRASAGPLAARVAVEIAGRDAAGIFGGPSPGVPPFFLTALDSGEPRFVNDLTSKDPERAARTARLGVAAIAVLPLRSRGSPAAALCLSSPRAGVFDEDTQALMLSAADNISLALDRFAARADLDRALAQRNELLHRLVDAQERERTRIAADVHDEPVQALAAVDLRLGLLARRIGDLAPGLAPEVERIHDSITSVSEQLRHLLFELEPIDPATTLTDLLAEAAAHVFELVPVAVTVENQADPAERLLSISCRTQAVRIAKEAMVNVARHADASVVRICVALDGDGVTVRVADDGVGVPLDVRRSPPGHRGISGMRDRAEVAGGRISIKASDPGTVVTLWLPRE